MLTHPENNTLKSNTQHWITDTYKNLFPKLSIVTHSNLLFLKLFHRLIPTKFYICHDLWIQFPVHIHHLSFLLSLDIIPWHTTFCNIVCLSKVSWYCSLCYMCLYTIVSAKGLRSLELYKCWTLYYYYYDPSLPCPPPKKKTKQNKTKNKTKPHICLGPQILYIFCIGNHFTHEYGKRGKTYKFSGT